MTITTLKLVTVGEHLVTASRRFVTSPFQHPRLYRKTSVKID